MFQEIIRIGGVILDWVSSQVYHFKRFSITSLNGRTDRYQQKDFLNNADPPISVVSIASTSVDE